MRERACQEETRFPGHTVIPTQVTPIISEMSKQIACLSRAHFKAIAKLMLGPMVTPFTPAYLYSGREEAAATTVQQQAVTRRVDSTFQQVGTKTERVERDRLVQIPNTCPKHFQPKLSGRSVARRIYRLVRRLKIALLTAVCGQCLREAASFE